MDRPSIKNLGRTITYNELRSFILDEGLSGDDTIVLNTDDFCSIVLEYRDTYHESLKNPHFLLNVLIRESEDETIPKNRIGVLKNDQESVRSVQEGFYAFDGEVIYRCGMCGNVVESNGESLEGVERQRAIYLIDQRKNVLQRDIDGDCCKEEIRKLYS